MNPAFCTVSLSVYLYIHPSIQQLHPENDILTSAGQIAMKLSVDIHSSEKIIYNVLITPLILLSWAYQVHSGHAEDVGTFSILPLQGHLGSKF